MNDRFADDVMPDQAGHGRFTPTLHRSPLREAIAALTRRPEPDLLPGLVEQARLTPAQAEASQALALRVARGVRESSRAGGTAGLVQGLLQEFALSSQEGVALMCLAEALLRIPDDATRDALIRDKIADGNWQQHLGQSPSLFVNAAAWGLLLTGKLVATHSAGGLAATLRRPGLARATLLVGGHVGPASDAERAERAALDAERAAILRRGDLAGFVEAWEALPLFATQRALAPEVQARQRTARLAHDPQALAWAFEVAGLAQMPDLRAAAAAARQPLHFLTGALDTRFRQLAASLARPPWVHHCSAPGAGHNLLLEAPAAVAASLLDLMETP